MPPIAASTWGVDGADCKDILAYNETSSAKLEVTGQKHPVTMHPGWVV